MRNRDRTGRPRRANLRRFILALLAVYPLWLVTANLALATGLVEWAASNDKRTLSFERAWTLWPTLVNVREFHILVDTKRIQLDLRVEEASVDLALWRLFGKHVQMDAVDARGARVHVRHKLREVDEDRIAKFAPMPGLPPPVRTPDDASGKGPSNWRIELDEVDASVDEVWVDEYRIGGEIAASGGFELHLSKPMKAALRPTQVELRDVWLETGERPVAEELEGMLAARFPEAPPRELLSKVSAVVRSSGRVVDLSHVSLPHPWSVAGGTGPLAVDVEVEQGHVVPGSRVVYRSAKLSLGHEAVTWAAKIEGEVEAKSDDAAQPSLHARVELRDLRMLHEGRAVAEAAKVNATGSTQGARLAELSLAAARAETEALVVDDFARLDPLLSTQKLALKGGRAQLDAKVTMDAKKVVAANVALELGDAAIDTGKFGVAASGTIEGEGRFVTASKALLLRGVAYDFDRLAVRTKAGRSEPILVQGVVERLDWQKHSGFDTSVRAQLGSVRPLFVHLTALDQWLPEELGFVDDDLLDVYFKVAKPRKGVLEVLIEEATVNALQDGMVRMSGVYRKVNERYRGAFLVTDPLELGLRIWTDESETELGADAAWLESAFAWVAGLDPSADVR